MIGLVQTEEKIIQLAALLHDVGKFWQGAGGRGKHAELSGRFVQGHVPWEGVLGLVSSHHDPSKYGSEGYKPLKTIVCADWLSSGERSELEDEKEEGNRKATPLMSLFSEIDIGKGKPASAQYYPIKKLELDKDIIFPKPLEGRGGKDRLESDYAGLWSGFIEEVDGIKAITDFDAYFNTLYHLLQKYTWCVPSAVWKSKLYENDALKASGNWNGYQHDWHNITITPSVTLRKGQEYRYVIETGSYPQIIHEHEYTDAIGGTITCDKFADVNWKVYTDWIPAIRLE